MDNKFRMEIPVLANSNIAYLDYAATTFMPKKVIEKWCQFQASTGVFISRGNSRLSRQADYELQKAEEKFSDFFKLSNNYEYIYSKNVTEAINIMAYSLEKYINELDIILIGPYEHHSNYLPWKYLAKRTGALFCEIPIDQYGNMDYSYIERYRDKIKIISVSSVSNAFGYKVDVDKICGLMSDTTFLFVDESQLCAHERICANDKISAHFIPSHKMYGPKNISLTAVKKDILDLMQPVILGGGMVESVGYEDYWLPGRKKFFAGTMDIGLIAAMAEACDFINGITYDEIQQKDLFYYQQVMNILQDNNYDVVSIKNSCVKYVVSFRHSTVHAHDINEYLCNHDVIIRSGNLCTQNSLRKLDLNAINRVSLGVGVCQGDIDALKKRLEEIVR